VGENVKQLCIWLLRGKTVISIESILKKNKNSDGFSLKGRLFRNGYLEMVI
jgi:hypothetical protein